MRTPLQVMLWELWRLSRGEMIARTVLVSVLWVGVLYLLPSKEVLGIMVYPTVLLMAIMSVFSGVWMNSLDNRRTGFVFYLGFTRPVRTGWLVALPMTYIAGASALCYLAPAALIRVLFDLPVPLLPTAAVVAFACMGFMTAVWSSETFAARVASLIATGACFTALAGFWIMRQVKTWDDLFTSHDALAAVFSFSANVYAVLLCFSVGCIAATVFAVDRQRHGERFSFKVLERQRGSRVGERTAQDRPFASAQQAQFWFEIKRSGLRVLRFSVVAALCSFSGILALDAGGILAINADGELHAKWMVLWSLIVFLSPFTFMTVGTEWLLGLTRRQGAVWLSTFDATQAMDNGRIVFIKVAVVIGSALLSWVFIAAAAALWTVLFGDYHAWLRLGSRIGSLLPTVPVFYWGFVGMLAAVSLVTASNMLISGALFIESYRKLAGMVLCTSFGYMLLALWDGNHHWLLKPFWIAHAYILAGGVVVATVAALRKVLGQRYLATRHFAVAMCIWAVYVGAAAALYRGLVPDIVHVRVPLPVLVLGLASLTVPLLAMALGPLALATHRHR